MASAPQTWKVLQAIQTAIQNEVLVSSASPFSAFSTADATKYGTTNAIYIGVPKDFKTVYTAQCWIAPPSQGHDVPIRRRLGGIIFQQQNMHIVTAYYAGGDYYTAMQSCINAADAMVPVLVKHADTEWNATCTAAKVLPDQTGYSYLNDAGVDWLCWSVTLWIEQQYAITGGIVP